MTVTFSFRIVTFSLTNRCKARASEHVSRWARGFDSTPAPAFRAVTQKEAVGSTWVSAPPYASSAGQPEVKAWLNASNHRSRGGAEFQDASLPRALQRGYVGGRYGVRGNGCKEYCRIRPRTYTRGRSSCAQDSRVSRGSHARSPDQYGHRRAT